jgi:K+-transporting ATPase A subunit
VIVVITLLQYVPMLGLGPIAEHFVSASGGTL